MTLPVVVALALLPVTPLAQAPAAARCAVGTWRLTGYQLKGTSKVYETAVLARGGAGTKVKIDAKGRFTYDFAKSAKVVTKGRTNGVKISMTALYRRVLKHDAAFTAKRITIKSWTAAGGALVKTVTTAPEKGTQLQKVAGLVRGGSATMVPDGRVAYVCGKTDLHLRRTVKLDGANGRTVGDWRFSRVR